MVIVAYFVLVHQCLDPSFAIGSQIPNDQVCVWSEPKIALVLMGNFSECGPKGIVLRVFYSPILDEHAIMMHTVRALSPPITI